MKKWFLLSITLWSCSLTHAADSERIESLHSKVVLENTNGYFVLSDGSSWKVIGFSSRWRSLMEWWNDVSMVPKNYETVPADWSLGAQIQVYSKAEHLGANEDNAANKDLLKQCTHLLVNIQTEQVLFAIALPPSQCITSLFDDARAEGYSQGFTKGSAQSRKELKKSYDRGYSEGHKAGYSEGYGDGVKGQRTDASAKPASQ